MKIKRFTLAATIATLGFMAPTAIASSAQADQPKPGPSVSAETVSQHAAQTSLTGADLTQKPADALGNQGTGSQITVVNGESTSTPSYFWPMRSPDPIRPGEQVTQKGKNEDSDDLHEYLRFSNSKMDIYAHNPRVKEAYLQIGGHKFWGNAGDIVLGGQRFDVRFDGTAWIDHYSYKCWTVVWKGSQGSGAEGGAAGRA